jgi:predicted PurR-regulated permease PerM
LHTTIFMNETSDTLRTWVRFSGCVLVVVVLYWAQAVLVPLALAMLLTFVLTPPVTWLERRLGRTAAVLAIAVLTFGLIGVAGWGLARQLDRLADDLPSYRVNILTKMADVRGAGKGSSVEKLQETIDDIRARLEERERPRGTASRPVVVASEGTAGVSGLRGSAPSSVP